MEPADHGEAVLNTVNLDALPVEALQALMASLSFQDAKRLCSSTPVLARRCKRNDLLELKAREYVDQHAPGTAPVTSYRKYADLLWRGFVTTYHVDIEDGQDQIAKFGFGGVRVANFNVPGVHREEGMDGWIFGYRGIDNYDVNFVEDCDFFDTKDHLIDEIISGSTYTDTVFYRLMPEDYRGKRSREEAGEILEAALDVLIAEGHEEYFAIHVLF